MSCGFRPFWRTVMNLFGSLIFFVFGVTFIWISRSSHAGKKTDYSQYPITSGTVLHIYDFVYDRWIVEFDAPDGRRVLGMDDVIASNTFHPEKYHLPKPGTTEQFYYWSLEERNLHHFSINHMPVEYYIHFCDETLYALSTEKERKSNIATLALGICIILAGLAVLFWVET